MVANSRIKGIQVGSIGAGPQIADLRLRDYAVAAHRRGTERASVHLNFHDCNTYLFVIAILARHDASLDWVLDESAARNLVHELADLGRAGVICAVGQAEVSCSS